MTETTCPTCGTIFVLEDDVELLPDHDRTVVSGFSVDRGPCPTSGAHLDTLEAP